MADGCDNAQTRLIINYLPQNLTDRVFLDIFSRVGQIESCKIMRDFKVSIYCILFNLHLIKKVGWNILKLGLGYYGICNFTENLV